MKHKITKKLVIYFSVLLVLFTLITGGLFVYFFASRSMDNSIANLEVQADKIAETLTLNRQSGNGHGQGKHSSNNHEESEISDEEYADDISLLEASIQGNIWVIDKNSSSVHVGHGGHSINYNDLPTEAEGLIEDAFSGETQSSQSFSSIMDTPTVSVVAPVFNNNGRVVAVVLLHTELSSIESGIKDGIFILGISLLISLLFVLILSIVLARKFVTPLKKMEKVTQTLSEGDYSVRTDVHQKDEIGSLALHIDVLAEKLDESEKYMSQVEQSRKDFMTKIAHELRTPVTVIRGSLEALKDGVIIDKDKTQDYYKQMLSDSIHLERMINDLLELSRLQNPDYAIKKEKVNVVDILSDAVRSLRPLTSSKNITIEYLKKESIYELDADYARLRQMFIIVLDNAIKFSPEYSQISVDVKNTDNEFSITISDQGCGIEESSLKNIFNKFYSSDSKSNSDGSGLGLAIAKEIAERHNIELVVDSKVSIGTTVMFNIKK
jgi:signal transduction histidine kinase